MTLIEKTLGEGLPTRTWETVTTSCRVTPLDRKRWARRSIRRAGSTTRSDECCLGRRKFTVEERDRVRDTILKMACADPRFVAGAMLVGTCFPITLDKVLPGLPLVEV
jgi:hypothetical protein